MHFFPSFTNCTAYKQICNVQSLNGVNYTLELQIYNSTVYQIIKIPQRNKKPS